MKTAKDGWKAQRGPIFIIGPLDLMLYSIVGLKLLVYFLPRYWQQIGPTNRHI